ncbi:MAG: dethiobiotin synthase [Neisseria sp.]|nr:dethiobiotin synthase [Neisseria sp.]
MTKAFFITGTDTEVGKTFCTAALLHAFAARNQRVVGFKPVASGALAGQNEDVLAVQTASSCALPYEMHNVYTFAEATAPHLAARDLGLTLDISQINQKMAALKEAAQADYLLIEGAGGWLTPLTPNVSFADWVQQQQLPVILVVGMKLGCLNHALLTAQAIRAAGLPLVGWVANVLSANPHRVDDYLADLQRYLSVPLLGVMPYVPNIDAQDAAKFLQIDALL